MGRTQEGESPMHWLHQTYDWTEAVHVDHRRASSVELRTTSTGTPRVRVNVRMSDVETEGWLSGTIPFIHTLTENRVTTRELSDVGTIHM